MEIEVGDQAGGYELLAVKSWVAYVRPVLGYGLAACLGFAIARFAHGFGTLGAIAALVRLAWKVLDLRSVRLFKDDRGIWVSRGFVPWNKQRFGVKWRDLDEALCFTDFWSWLLRSYTIRIGHRFTKGAEIRLSHMRRGAVVVQTINSAHQSLIGTTALA